MLAVLGLKGGWRDRNELWTDRITSSRMYFRGLKPDMHAIVILNHRLGKPGPRSLRSRRPGGEGGQREGIGDGVGGQKYGQGGRWRINHPDELRGEFSSAGETFKAKKHLLTFYIPLLLAFVNIS